MKFSILLLVVILCSALCPANAINNKDLIEIYFLNNEHNLRHDAVEHYQYKLVHKTDELYRSIAENKPMIRTDDIAGYVWNKHCIYLEKESWNYIRRYFSLKRPRNFEIIFVVLVDRKIIYYGFFMNGNLSYTIPIPTIETKYFHEREPFMPKKMTEKQAFSITFVNMENQINEPSQNPELYNRLPRGVRDPRNNPLLYQALHQTGKLCSEK